MKIHPRAFLTVLTACAGVLGAVPFASAATVDWTIHFRGINRNSHVEFVWKRFATPSQFKMYKIVRSEPGGPSAADEGDITATTTNRYSTNSIDWPPHNGTYYYRLCVVKKDDSVVCSRVVKIVITSAVERPTPPVPSLNITSVSTTTPEPVVPVVSAPSGEMDLTLSASASGTVVTWTPSLATPSRYVLVRSFSNPDLSYPVDGYLAKIASEAPRSFVDTVYVDPAMYHAKRFYRVCIVQDFASVRCGSVASITP